MFMKLPQNVKKTVHIYVMANAFQNTTTKVFKYSILFRHMAMLLYFNQSVNC